MVTFTMDEIIKVILHEMPVGLIVLDQKMKVLFRNRRAKGFIKTHGLPPPIRATAKEIMKTIGAPGLKVSSAEDIYLTGRLPGSQNIWTCRFGAGEFPGPHVSVWLSEQATSRRSYVEKIRKNFSLTRRETEVLEHVLKSLKASDIAVQLNISQQTVKEHLSRIYRKVGVKNKITLVNYLNQLEHSSF